MKRPTTVLLLLTLLIALFAALPASADPEPLDPNNVVGCEELNKDWLDAYLNALGIGGAFKEFFAGDRIQITIDTNATLYLKFNDQIIVSGSSPLEYTVPVHTVANSITIGTQDSSKGNMTVTCWHEGDDDGSEAGPPCYNALDGRINRSTTVDCSAPVAVYSGDWLDIYAVSPQTGAGNRVFRIDPKTLVAQATNQTLWQGVNPFDGQPLIVSLLSTGEVQVNAFYRDGKPYTIAWPANAPQNFYHIAW
jgi:hypothetical protein